MMGGQKIALDGASEVPAVAAGEVEHAVAGLERRTERDDELGAVAQVGRRVGVLPAPTVASDVSIPELDATRISPVFAKMRNWPLLSAVTPVCVPLILTETPGKASPFSSVTVPVIVRF